MSEKEVRYRPVPDFPGYRVGDDGSVWSCWRRDGWNNKPRVLCEVWTPLKLVPDSNRPHYLLVNLYRGGRPSNRRVHRLVLEAFVGPCPTGMEGCHNNGDKQDCRLSNLRWDTKGANQIDIIRHGRRRTKLTESQVKEIRQAIAAGVPRGEIASRFNVKPCTISSIRHGRLWGWVP